MYKVTTRIYPVADNDDWIEYEEEVDALILINQEELVLKLLREYKCSGGEMVCEIDVEKDGEYYDNDEFTLIVADDLSKVIEWY